MSEEGFKAGRAYIDLDINDNTDKGVQKAKEEIEATPPAKMPMDADNPINDAWKAKVRAAIASTAKDTLKIPLTPETADLRANIQRALDEAESAVKGDIPLTVADADKFKLEVEATVKEAQETAKINVPVEVDKDKAKKDADAAASDIGKSFTSTFGNGIAPMPLLISAAVIAAAPLVGSAMIGVAGAGMAGAAVAIASGSQDVQDRFQALSEALGAQAESLRPRLTAPIVDALDEVRDQFAIVAPQIGNDLIMAESAIKPLTEGVLGLAENALPGLTMAVTTQGPVMQGFKSLLVDTGKSLGDMFTSFSQHSQAFGTDTATLGSIIRSVMGLLTSVVNTAGEAWAKNSGQITGAINSLMSGLGQLTTSAIPALTSELANVLSVLGFFATVLGDVSHALGPLSGDIMAVALSAKLLGVNLTGIPKLLQDLPGKLEDVAGGTGKFAGAAGALGTALPAISAGLGVVAAGFGAVAIGASMAAAHEQDLVDAGTALGHSMVDGGTAAADAATKLRGLQGNVYSLQDQVQQLSHQADAGTTAMNEYGGGYSATASKSVELQGKLQDLNIELAAAKKAEQDYRDQLGPVGVAQAVAAQAQKDYNDAVGKYGPASNEAQSAAKTLAKANADVTAQQQNLNNAMSLSQATMGTFEKPALGLQADLAKIGDAASTDSDKITAMKDALIKLSGGAIPVGDAMEAIDKVMTSIQTQMQQGIKAADGYGKAILNSDGSVRTVTKNGQLLRDTMTDLRGKFVDAAAAIVSEDEAQGKSADQAKAHAQAVLEQQIPAVEKLGESMGLTKKQVDDALKSMGAWPADLTTMVATPGVEQAQQAMDILKGKVMDVPNDHTIHTSALTDAAIQQLRDLGLVVTSLPDGTVMVTANTELAKEAAQSVVTQINGMRAVIHVDAQGNTSSISFGKTSMNASGNLLMPMAAGGIAGHTLTSMSGAQASVVPPNTWRVIGDNMRVPELYAPLDGSQRSASLIAQAAVHEGLTVPVQRSVTINQTVIAADPQQAADKAAGAVAWAMSSARG